MRVSAFWKPLTACLIATPICLLLAVVSGGGGHGNYLWAKILFPYTMVSTSIFESITTPFILLAIIQFPLYGIALGMANRKHKVAQMIVVLSVVHLLAVTITFLFSNDNFS
jgi:hypothetical protein